MTIEKAVEALIANAGRVAECRARRAAWARETSDAWSEALRAMDDKCTEAFERLSQEEFERLYDEEEAKVGAIRAELDAVIEHDRWPRHLYFGGL